MATLLEWRRHPRLEARSSRRGSQAGVITDARRTAGRRIIDIKPGPDRRRDGRRRDPHSVAGFQGVAQKTREVTTMAAARRDTTRFALAAAWVRRRAVRDLHRGGRRFTRPPGCPVRPADPADQLRGTDPGGRCGAKVLMCCDRGIRGTIRGSITCGNSFHQPRRHLGQEGTRPTSRR